MESSTCNGCFLTYGNSSHKLSSWCENRCTGKPTDMTTKRDVFTVLGFAAKFVDTHSKTM